MFYLIQEGENFYVDREQRVIQRLVQNPETQAFRIDPSDTGKPKLTEAKLGNRNDIVARLVVKDLVVGGDSVAEAQVQIQEEANVAP